MSLTYCRWAICSNCYNCRVCCSILAMPCIASALHRILWYVFTRYYRLRGATVARLTPVLSSNQKVACSNHVVVRIISFLQFKTAYCSEWVRLKGVTQGVRLASSSRRKNGGESVGQAWGLEMGAGACGLRPRDDRTSTSRLVTIFSVGQLSYIASNTITLGVGITVILPLQPCHRLKLLPNEHFIMQRKKQGLRMGVPWCNGHHAGLWIQQSEFKSRWNLEPDLRFKNTPTGFQMAYNRT